MKFFMNLFCLIVIVHSLAVRRSLEQQKPSRMDVESSEDLDAWMMSPPKRPPPPPAPAVNTRPAPNVMATPLPPRPPTHNQQSAPRQLMTPAPSLSRGGQQVTERSLLDCIDELWAAAYDNGLRQWAQRSSQARRQLCTLRTLQLLGIYNQCCSCHATRQDGVLPGRSNRQQSPAGPVNMRRNTRCL